MIRIGNGSAFWGDSPKGALQLLQEFPDLDVLTLDYLAELSLSILAVQKKKDPSLGFVPDFLEVIDLLLPKLKRGGLKILTNAGGLNPRAVAHAVKKKAPHLSVAFIEGDSVLGKELTPLREALPEKLETANAYIGAAPLVTALKLGADIVIGGRIADPSLTVAPIMHHFGWNEDAYDKIALATLAGHLIECGRQVTGGISAGWSALPARLSFPVIEVEEESFSVVGKTVTRRSVLEQMLYELFDPGHYLSPDVTASFQNVTLLEEKGRVTVRNAKGALPTETYKVSATYAAGYKAEGTLLIFGDRAAENAQRAGEVLFERLSLPFDETLIELLGTGAAVPVFPPIQTNEVLLRVAARSKVRAHLEAFSKEIASLVTSGPPGTTGYTAGRPKIRELFGFIPALIPKKEVPLKVEIL